VITAVAEERELDNIMTSGCSMDEAKPDTLRAMIDFTKEYGVYR
jgi:hypothetical protein